MRRPLQLVVPAAMAAWLVASPARAQDDNPAMLARMAAMDGKFREADGIVERAPPEVQNDPALHRGLGEIALRAVHTMPIDAKPESKRDPFFSARQHFAKVIDLTPADAVAAAGVLEACKGLADLDSAARNFDDAKNESKFALASAEKAQTAGVASPDFKLALGRMYGLRASFLKNMNDVAQLDSDSKKAATLMSEAAVGNEQAGKILSEASAIRLRVAGLVHEGIPDASETRDDQALIDATDLATKACNLKGAADADYATHLEALRLAHLWGLKVMIKPFMQPVMPGMEGLKLEVPKAPGWIRGKPAQDWDLIYDRNLHETKNDGAVQITLKKHAAGEMALGKTWGALADQAARQFEKVKGDFKETASVADLVQLGGGKSEVWYFAVSGNFAVSDTKNRLVRDAEWYWPADKKKDFIWALKVKDWRPVPDVEEPDIVAFVASAIGDGLWPPVKGAPDPKKPPPDDPKKKKK